MDELNYSKISNQDIKIAEVFFENDKHLDEFLANVSRYYSKKPLTIKTKIVKKYFAAYTKTMDFVIQAREKGKVGGDKRAEIQANKNDTLQGGLDNPKTTLDDTLQPNINSKVISNNIKNNINVDFDDFIESFNMIVGKNYKPIEKVKSAFIARIKQGYTSSQMLEALEKAVIDVYHIDTKFKYLTPEFITRQDKLDKWLNS